MEPTGAFNFIYADRDLNDIHVFVLFMRATSLESDDCYFMILVLQERLQSSTSGPLVEGGQAPAEADRIRWRHVELTP